MTPMLVHHPKVILAIISRKIRQKVEKRGAKLQTALTTLFRVSPYVCVCGIGRSGAFMSTPAHGRRVMPFICANSGPKHLPKGENGIFGAFLDPCHNPCS